MDHGNAAAKDGERPIFQLKFSGDMGDAGGNPAMDLGEDLLAHAPGICYGLLADQCPNPLDPTYKDRLYSMEIEPRHVAAASGIVVCRPWVKAAAFAGGAANLLAIGRAGNRLRQNRPASLHRQQRPGVQLALWPDALHGGGGLVLHSRTVQAFPLQQRILRDGRWDLQKDAVGDDLGGQTLGIVGLGRSGAELARLIAPFQMRLMAFSPHAEPAEARRLGVTLVDSLDGLLRESDYASLHCRLTERTRGMLGRGNWG